MPTWQQSKAEADLCFPTIEKIIRQMAGHIVTVKESTACQDEKESTDYIIEVSSGTIACRVRKPYYWREWGDFTLRSQRPGGTETELAKIKKGFARWYLYVWAERDEPPEAWAWIDLMMLRASGLLYTEQAETWNRDRSSAFISLNLTDLYNALCITAASQSVYDRLGLTEIT